MIMRNKSLKVKISKKWEWTNCDLNMHIEKDGVHIYRHLESKCQLVDNDQNLKDVLVDINQQRSFNYSKRVGWNWHKSWKIPDITVTLESDGVITNNLIRCRLLTGIIEDVYTVKNTPLIGVIDVPLDKNINGFLFTNVKFNQTSYQQDGSYFHLIVEIYINDELFNTQQGLKTLISPPLFIDSRKSARNTRRFQYQVLTSQVQPFHPYLLQKNLIIRQGKGNQFLQVDDSATGFNQYLVAQNIRQKCRHPYFLAQKFQSIFNLYYNAKFVGGHQTIEQILIQIQRTLIETIYKKDDKLKFNYNKLLLLQIKEDIAVDGNLQANLSQIASPLLLIQGSQQVDNNWIHIDSRQLNSIYQRIYPKLGRLEDQQVKIIKDDFDISSDESVSDACQYHEQFETANQERTVIQLQGPIKKVCC
ncbi:hypothetical protein pb186bvf_017815 [Paramecium bursaria]